MLHSKAVDLMDPAEVLGASVAAVRSDVAALSTSHSGTSAWSNPDGSLTVMGPAAGDQTVATHVGDTEPPPRPTGVIASTGDGRVSVSWDGTLADDIPPDFLQVNVYVDGRPIGSLQGAGTVVSPPIEPGAVVEVTANAEDDACLFDGTPAHNESGPSDAISVAVSDAALDAVTDVWQEYWLSDSESPPPDDAVWTRVPAEQLAGKIVWQRSVTRFGDGSEERGGPVRVTGNAGADAVTVRVDSSRGTVFKNNEVSTVLSACVYTGPERIVDAASLRAAFGPSARLEWLWQPMGADGFSTLSAADPRLSREGFDLTLSPDDVDVKVTVCCRLTTD